MKRMDFICLAFLIIAVILLFYPVFHAEYLFTDDAPQLWLFKDGLNFTGSVPQGRYVTYKVFTWVFRSIHTIQDVTGARLFSFFGWIACLPAWYFIINKVVLRNNLPKSMGLLSLVYLICLPPFALSIGWAACLELFIACTSGLIAGYLFYAGIRYDGQRVHVSNVSIILSIVFGMLSLFTYQNGFGCFFLPFFLHFIASKKIDKTIRIGLGFSVLIYLIYFLLFKYSLRVNGLGASDRSGFAIDPIRKIGFFFSRPLASAFHFTWIVNEKSIAGIVCYVLLAVAWLAVNLYRQRPASLSEKSSYIGGLLVFFVLIYLPQLIVRENYSSNRTLLALDLAVFFLVAETVYSFLANHRIRNLVTGLAAGLFLINAWYNFNRQFLDPLTAEYRLVKDQVRDHYEPGIKMVYMIRPGEDAFHKRYGIVQSWDEFGIPSTAMPWTPESLIKQLIFEKTGNRPLAEAVIVKSGLSSEASQRPPDKDSAKTLVIDVEKMLLAP